MQVLLGLLADEAEIGEDDVAHHEADGKDDEQNNDSPAIEYVDQDGVLSVQEFMVGNVGQLALRLIQKQDQQIVSDN